MTFGSKTNGKITTSPPDHYFEFFKEGNRYVITKFQRPYSWTEYQIRGIIKDIEYVSATNQEVGWPSMLIQKRIDNEKPNVQLYDLGDGQQRVISVALALLAIWQRGQALREMGIVTEEESTFLERIIPSNRSNDIKPFLCEKKIQPSGTVSIEPVIEFSSAKTNLEFKSLFSRITEDKFNQIIEKASNEQDENHRLYKAFAIYFDYFKNFSIKELEERYDILLTKINLSVLQYDENEDMQRAFSNMNSFGIALSQGELIKAELYGIAKKFDFSLAEEVADYWILNLETPFWEQIWSGNKQNRYLDYCLEQSFNSYNNWPKARIVSNSPYEEMRQDGQKNKHLLRDLWRRYLDLNIKSAEDFNLLWQNLKADFVVFETALNSTPFTETTLEWELNYAYQIIGKSGKMPSIISIFMRLSRILPAEDLIDAIRTITKYFLYVYIVKGNKNISNLEVVLIGVKSSPLTNEKTTNREIINFLESLTAGKTQWLSQEEIRNILLKTSYDNSYNAIISELFVYALNEAKRENKLNTSLFNTRKLDAFEAEKSREHILPQNPRNMKELQKQPGFDKGEYDRFVGMLGNVLILSKDENSAANNKAVNEKTLIYKKEINQAAWGSYITDFITYWDTYQTWHYSDIEKRTADIADSLSKVLAPINPNNIDISSTFKELIVSSIFPAGTIFCMKNKDGSLINGITLTEHGNLIFNGKVIRYLEGLDALSGTNRRKWRESLLFENSEGKLISIKEFMQSK